jgi:CDP-glucose 4,6-dehydratase
MEAVGMSVKDSFRGRRVLITGHTGFKGAWLSEWLLSLGAEVAGYSIDTLPDRSCFVDLRLADRMTDFRGDICDRAALGSTLKKFDPEVIFHLAAQPLVRLSYREPVETFSTNVLGSVHLLEAARTLSSLRALVHVTSDKCYENFGKGCGYVETDPMGGSDPYSASKGAAELVFQSFSRSFFGDSQVRIATARAGNVFGAGDWAEDRILPDCVRAWSQGRAVELRNPASTRPWQHVLDCLDGYLTLASELLREGTQLPQGSAFNFGPPADDEWSVEKLVRFFAAHWGEKVRLEVPVAEITTLKEATRLTLDSSKARRELGWRPRLQLSEALQWAARGYGLKDAAALGDEIRTQINSYMQKGRI